MSNSLLAPSTLPFALPDYPHLSDADFRVAIEVGMTEQLAELDAVATDPEPATEENVLAAWERSGGTLSRALSAFWVAKAADTNDERDAIEAEMSPRLAAHGDAILLDRRLYDRLLALAARRDAGEVELDDQADFLLAERLRDYERGGIHLSGADQDRLRALNGEIATLSSRFDLLLVAGRNAAAVRVTDAEELTGLDEDERQAAREAAAGRGLEGWLLELTNTSGQPVLARLAHRPLRERVHRASVGRGLGGEHDTREVLLRLARLRAERARLLGYPHHAAYVAEDGCAGSSDAVTEILTRLAAGAVAKLGPVADELAERFAREAPGERLEPWDWHYTAGLADDQGTSFDPDALRPYLELERVLTEGVLAAATGLYGLTFHRRDDLVGYTDQAGVLEVREQDGSVLGAVVLDLMARPSKQGGAWMTSLVEQSSLLDTHPVVTVTCNLVPPSAGRPALLTWDNVITLFHEFGHALHGLLSQVRYPSRSGTRVPRDFVEYPSQVNEIWAREPALLARYARHHETGEPLPDAWVDELRATGRANEEYALTELLAAMLLDQAWHRTPAEELPDSAEGVEEFERVALERAGVAHRLVPPRYRSAYFHHIFGGGYAAAYYSYLWSEVLDADTVAWFAEHGMLDRAAGDRFRHRLLAVGGSRDPMAAYRDFRGSDPDLTHLLRRYGMP